MSVRQLLSTTVVGSYPQPDWLVDREMLGSRLPPRTRAAEIWRVSPDMLEQAQDDATLLAIRDMDRAGVDIITDGEIRRESYSNRFATALEGMDIDNPGTALDRTGHPNPVPRVVGPIRRRGPVEKRDVEFLRANTDRAVRATVPGPFTMSQQAQDDYYGDPAQFAFALADAVREEIADLFAAGADIVQLDEPYLQARPEAAREFAVAAINRALDGASGTTALHSCFGYAHIVHTRGTGYPFLEELTEVHVDQLLFETAQPRLDPAVFSCFSDKDVALGVIDLGDDAPVEDVDSVVSRIRAALRHIEPNHLLVAPDCGMKYLPREKAFRKLVVMVEAAARVRQSL